MPTSVLVVDDDVAFRRLASRMLSVLGLVVIAEAGSVATALAVCEELRPDAALVDIGLPDGDGVSLAAALSAFPWRPRVLLTSSDADATDAAAARQAGAVGFIAKDQLPNDSVLGLLAGH
jgi:CheY-like chemotaxis protein